MGEEVEMCIRDRSINKELYSGKFKVLDIKDLVMFREFDFVQLQGQDTGLPTCLLYTSKCV